VRQATLIDMEKQRLLHSLEELRAELSQAEEVDPETLAELRRLTNDIQNKLKGRQDESWSKELEPTTSGLKDLLLKYEADHPQLSVAVGRVADALASMGI
jgi:hypothetical protein